MHGAHIAAGAREAGRLPVCLMIPFCAATAFGPCVGAAYMPPAEPPRHRPLPVCMVFTPHCRGRMHAARETLRHCPLPGRPDVYLTL